MNATETEELTRLSDLLKTGMLSKEEYDEAKKRIDHTPPPSNENVVTPQSSDKPHVETAYGVAQSFAWFLIAVK